MGIIPGSMGARSYIVRGLGNDESFHSCSHGAGRAMSRNEAKRRFSIDDHIKATAGVECRKDKDVIDETPMAYKPIEDVMNAQKDLIEIVHTLRQVVCVKGRERTGWMLEYWSIGFPTAHHSTTALLQYSSLFSVFQSRLASERETSYSD